MKKLLLILGVSTVFFAVGTTTYAEESMDFNETNNEKAVNIEEEETLFIEKGKTYHLDNGVTITSLDNESTKELHKILEDSNNIGTLGAGEWDHLGTSNFKSTSRTFNSGGGDLLIFIDQTSNKDLYRLKEEDLGGMVYADVVPQFQLDKGSHALEFNIRGWTDGDDEKAELSLSKLTNPFTTVYTDWWD